MSGRIIPTILGKGWRFPGNCATAHLLVFDGWPGTIKATLGVSFGLLMGYDEHILRIEV